MKITRTLLLTPLIAGCYSYATLTPAAAPPGTEVRARITGAASDRVGSQLGSYDTREVVGNVIENTNGELLLDVVLGTRPNASESTGPLHTHVSLAPSDFVNIEQRKLDGLRTSLLVAGILAGVGAGVALALHNGGGGSIGSGPPGPPPIVRIPIRVWGKVF